MRLRLLASLVLPLAATLSAPALEHVEVEGCGRTSPDRVVLRGGATVELTVSGRGVDLTRAVSTSGLPSGLDVSIRGKRGGSSPAIVLSVQVPGDVTDGDDGRITLRTPAGDESLHVTLLAPALVESIVVTKARLADGTFRLDPSHAYDVLVKGKRLWDLVVARQPPGGSVSVGSRADHQLVLHLRTESSGSFRLSAASLASPRGCAGRLVAGDGEALVTIDERQAPN